MMAAINLLEPWMNYPKSLILTQHDDGSHLEFCHLEIGYPGIIHSSFSSQTHSHLPRLVPTIYTKKNFTHSFWLNLMIVAILYSAILNLDTLESAILNSQFFLSNSFTLAKTGSHHFHKRNFTHSFWLNLMMAAILNSAMLNPDTAILDSVTLLSSLRFTQKHSHSTLTLTQTNSICIKLIHSHLTWWWQPSWNLPSWIQPS